MATHKKEKAFRYFNDAWREREREMHSMHSAKARSLERHIAALRQDLRQAHNRISDLELSKEQLERQAHQMQTQHRHFEHLRSTLLETLGERDLDGYRFSFKTGSPVSWNTGQSSPVRREVSGKQFFAEAKARLSFENFSRFLAYVKQLNDKSIPKQQAIREVKAVFGQETDLYSDFVYLLSRH